MEATHTQRITNILLRLSVAFAFLYPPLNAIQNPDSWIGYFPQFIRGVGGLSDLTLLHTFGAIEIIIALWILSGKKIFIPSVLAAIMLAAIVVFDYRDFEILFRDVSIAFAALALAALNLKDMPGRNKTGQAT